ncbi:anti-sigma factor family protein [Geodermatophilus sp. CPCC 206100]|uniref:anti-sigma factor family protein n=1 Tax=Geodermatophilus sp. CPCC 206100 TaxID=3020054 RepID=UPI003AFFFC62
MTCRAAVPDLGAYLLGALEEDERRAVQDHLRGCEDCHAELAELAQLPGLLALVDPRDLQSPPVAPSPDLFARVAAAARRPRRARRLLLVAAAFLLLAGGVWAGVTLWPHPDATTVTATNGGVELAVTATAGGGGTVLDIAVTGLAPQDECRLVAVDRDGREHPAGQWGVDDAGGGTWRGWADVDAATVTDVVLLDGSGAELVRAPL